MQGKINVYDFLIGAVVGINAWHLLHFFFEKLSPHFSGGPDLCCICKGDECETYDNFCDDCAEDVKEEFRDKGKKNLEMYN